MIASPFPALAPGADGLSEPPASPEALRQRMAAVYGVPAENLLPVRGAAHGLELVLRSMVKRGQRRVSSTEPALIAPLCSAYGVLLVADGEYEVRIIAAPGLVAGKALTLDAARALAAQEPDKRLVIDERFAEVAGRAPLSAFAASTPNVISIRCLSFLHGLAGAPCGAIVASTALVEELTAALDPGAIATPVRRLAEAALDPSRQAAVESRIALFREERDRVARALAKAPSVAEVRAGDGPQIAIVAHAPAVAVEACRKWAVAISVDDGAIVAPIGDGAANDRLLSAFGVGDPRPARRRAEIVRDTLETRIVVSVDLDIEGGPDIRTGVGYFDHMLSQIATHGGFALSLHCEGDVDVDPHHTIEDCALALGQALSAALGARKGFARFGFALPMDETEAQVTLDIGGRPYAVFKGSFASPLLGGYPTEMTEHVFRSLAQSLGAAIHVAVTGANDHHMTEACFKAFGRALRQAVRRDGDATPSTKGVIA